MFHMNGNKNVRNIENMAAYTNIQLYEEIYSRLNYLKKQNDIFHDLYTKYIKDKTNKNNQNNLLQFIDNKERKRNLKAIILDTEPIVEELISRFYRVTVDIEEIFNPESSIFKFRQHDEETGVIIDKVTYIGYIKNSRLFNNFDSIIDLKPRMEFITNSKPDSINHLFKDRYFIEIFRFDRNNFAHSSNIEGKQLHDFILAYLSTNTYSVPSGVLNSNMYILDDYFKYKFNKCSNNKKNRIRSSMEEYNKFINLCINSFLKHYEQRYEMLDNMIDSLLELSNLVILTINFRNRDLVRDYMSSEKFDRYEKFIYNTIIRYSDNELQYNVKKGIKKRELSEMLSDTLPQF